MCLSRSNWSLWVFAWRIRRLILCFCARQFNLLIFRYLQRRPLRILGSSLSISILISAASLFCQKSSFSIVATSLSSAWILRPKLGLLKPFFLTNWSYSILEVEMLFCIFLISVSFLSILFSRLSILSSKTWSAVTSVSVWGVLVGESPKEPLRREMKCLNIVRLESKAALKLIDSMRKY